MVSNEGWTLSLVLCLQRYFLLSFIALARLSSSWALDLLISPYITSQHPCSPAGLPAPSSKGHTPLFCSLSSSQSSLLNQVGSSPTVAHPLAHGDGWAAPAVPLGFLLQELQLSWTSQPFRAASQGTLPTQLPNTVCPLEVQGRSSAATPPSA